MNDLKYCIICELERPLFEETFFFYTINSTKQIYLKGVGIMARMSKMDYQMHCRMQMMLNVNKSRHQAKKKYKEMMGKNESNRMIGIHSHLTYDAYKQTIIEFIRSE